VFQCKNSLIFLEKKFASFCHRMCILRILVTNVLGCNGLCILIVAFNAAGFICRSCFLVRLFIRELHLFMLLWISSCVLVASELES
jgi:hypothetical protein